MSRIETTVACQMYPWFLRYKKREQNWRDHLDGILASLAESGYQGWDQSYPDETEARAVKTLLDKHGLIARSQYVGGRWHDPDTIAKTLDEAKRSAEAGRSIGVRVIVCNPEPIAWGQPLDKNDDQIKRQCEAFCQYGQWLAKMGMKLAYHTHDPEMRQGAREFHHMMLSSDPAVVGFCLDVHWVYRGLGNSQVGLDDIIQLYGDRITALHLRQSRNGVWTQALGDGDINYRPLAAKLEEIRFAGPIIAECATESTTPQTLSDLEADRISRQWIQKTLGF